MPAATHLCCNHGQGSIRGGQPIDGSLQRCEGLLRLWLQGRCFIAQEAA